MADNDQEKTEEPTAKRKTKARNDGNVAKSEEVSNLVMFAAALFLFLVFGKHLMSNMENLVRDSFGNLEITLTNLSTQEIFVQYLKKYFYILAPFMVGMLIAVFVASYIQIGWLFSAKSLEWKWDALYKMDFKQFFSLEKLKSLLKSIIKLVVLFGITYAIMKNELDKIMNFVDLSVEQLFGEVARLVKKMLVSVIYVYVVIAGADYAITRFLHFKKLKMTKQEIKDERKQMEGDPKIKQKIRQVMMAEAQKRMMQEVPESDVVITNPIHLAVALKYDANSSQAPIVVAKGKRLIAEKIKELARKNDIPIVENKILARMLYKSSELGKEIDFDLYEAVAEVLAQIYKIKNKKFS